MASSIDFSFAQIVRVFEAGGIRSIHHVAREKY
jgi:hypothetical protein